MPEELPLLVEGAQQLGFELTEEQKSRFQLYYETLIDWNSRINLTAIIDYEGVQVRHFLDSLTVASALQTELYGSGSIKPPPPGYRVIDIGTGAGFPGVPLKILWPGIRLTLNDSIGKKTVFLSELVRVLGLEDVQVVTGRAEELGQNKEHRQRYDLATARAVSALPVLCEYGLPLLKVGGTMLTPKKGDISLEIATARKAAPIVGGKLGTSYQFTLPGDEEPRQVIALRKVAPTPAAYPRRTGLAKMHPLGL